MTLIQGVAVLAFVCLALAAAVVALEIRENARRERGQDYYQRSALAATATAQARKEWRG